MDVVVYEGDDCSALYVDGKLVESGDVYGVDVKIRELFKIPTIYSDAFTFDGSGDIAETIDEIHAWEQEQI